MTSVLDLACPLSRQFEVFGESLTRGSNSRAKRKKKLSGASISGPSPS
jgi:hypothetical protein